jgi:hypothetical protein
MLEKRVRRIAAPEVELYCKRTEKCDEAGRKRIIRERTGHSTATSSAELTGRGEGSNGGDEGEQKESASQWIAVLPPPPGPDSRFLRANGFNADPGSSRLQL